MPIQLIQADIMEYLSLYVQGIQSGDNLPFHAAFGDTPYFLASINKRFGKDGSKPARYGQDGAFQRQGRGFMNVKWDGFEDVWAYQEWVRQWGALLLQCVYPNSFGLFFGGTRTFHRIAAGLEDAGWIIYDSVLYLYGSGFPKAHDVDGYKTALKPAYEMVVLARAPRTDTYEAHFRQDGVGMLDVDAGRIAFEGKAPSGSGKLNAWRDLEQRGDRQDYSKTSTPDAGRYPANLILDEEAAALLDAQSGERKAGGNLKGDEPSQLNRIYNGASRQQHESYADSGGASRFFYTAKSQSWERDAGLDAFTSGAIADGRDKSIDNPYQRGETERKNTHPTVKAIRLTEYLSKLILPPEVHKPRRLFIPFSGVASEVIGARFAGWDEIVGVDREAEYHPIAEARVKWWSGFKSYDEAQSAWKRAKKLVEKGKPVTALPQQLPLFEEV